MQALRSIKTTRRGQLMQRRLRRPAAAQSKGEARGARKAARSAFMPPACEEPTRPLNLAFSVTQAVQQRSEAVRPQIAAAGAEAPRASHLAGRHAACGGKRRAAMAARILERPDSLLRTTLGRPKTVWKTLAIANGGSGNELAS